MSVVKWRVYCNTESSWVSGYLPEGTSPSVCFTDTGHTINTNSYQQDETISNTNVSILEEITPTGGHYKSVSYKCDCTVGESIHDYTFDYPISALGISFISHSDNQNDTLEVIIGPETTIGTITSDVTASDTIINVSSTVMDNIKIGYYVNLDDTTNNDNLGIVTNVDTVNSQITIKTPTTNAFLTSTPSYVKMSVKVIDNFTFGYAGRYVLGDCKIGGSYIPAGTIIKVIYTNNGGATRYFYPVIEYLY